MSKNNIIIYSLILVFGIIAPFLFPAYKLQISILWILTILALTWDIQGGQMGYNSFGNILFFGVGMYVCSSVQIGMFFPLSEWTASGGEKTFLHTTSQYFQGFTYGLFFAGIVPAIVAALIGYGILGLRGHYFAICTLGIGIAAGEIAGGIDLIGAGQGMTVPPWPKGIGGTELRSQFFYYLCFLTVCVTFLVIRLIYQTRFGLVINAIRDNEDKAEAMGIHTMRYKIIGWVVSAFFLGIAGGLMGNMIGYIEPTEIAFAGSTYGVFMVLMAILGGKGTLWGPVIGAAVFHVFKEGFWTFFLGWQYVALGALIIVIVIFFPEGILGWFREKYPENFGEVVDEVDLTAQVELT
ncbi:MAG: branched-chain amino acid ABC transporter permease [SAR324 cluster bacterium]|nr:branched-chain amino acid ABC transporter permease [SAR324 cluster bacterium]